MLLAARGGLTTLRPRGPLCSLISPAATTITTSGHAPVLVVALLDAGAGCAAAHLPCTGTACDTRCSGSVTLASTVGGLSSSVRGTAGFCNLRNSGIVIGRIATAGSVVVQVWSTPGLVPDTKVSPLTSLLANAHIAGPKVLWRQACATPVLVVARTLCGPCQSLHCPFTIVRTGQSLLSVVARVSRLTVVLVATSGESWLPVP